VAVEAVTLAEIQVQVLIVAEVHQVFQQYHPQVVAEAEL
jgi:hypothetical protein